MIPDTSSYQSPLSFRYGSPEMRRLFSEEHKYRLWRQIWVALAAAEHAAGLVSAEELADLRRAQGDIDIARIYEIELGGEAPTKHDVVAAIREFAEKAAVGGGKIHLGATSMDVNDNANALRIVAAMELTEQRVKAVLRELAGKIVAEADAPCLGYTHLQPAEPTTIGYRLAFYAQDLLSDLRGLRAARAQFVGKGMKGAVGTRASYAAALEGSGMSAAQLDEAVMAELGVKGALITTQIVSQKQEYQVLTVLAGVGASLAKFAGDLRLLQSPGFGEWSEPFGKGQVGSSAMPFKKNPLDSEKICSLARLLAALPGVALENASLSYLERTLDDSANRRLVLPEAFLLVDELLLTATKIISGMVLNRPRIARNLETYAPFSATGAIIIAAVKQGADRQDMHELLREIAMKAWADISQGGSGEMGQLLRENQELAKYVTPAEMDRLLDGGSQVGDAPTRARELAALVKTALKG